MQTETGKIIKQIREELNLNQREFANEIGITPAYVGLIETTKIPSQYVINDIVTAYIKLSMKQTEEKEKFVNTLRQVAVSDYRQKRLKAMDRKIELYAVSTVG